MSRSRSQVVCRHIWTVERRADDEVKSISTVAGLRDTACGHVDDTQQLRVGRVESRKDDVMIVL